MIDDLIYKASLLVYKGLQPKLSPEKDKDYRELLRLSLSSYEFADAVQSIAEGLSLTVVDTSDRGIILSPASTESRFAMGIGDYRKELSGDTDVQNKDAVSRRGLIALVQVAVAAVFFPTAAVLDEDDDEVLGKSAQIGDIDHVLTAMCRQVTEEEDQELISPSMRKGADLVLSMPEALPEGKIDTLRSRHGAIGIVTRHLDRVGLLKVQETNDGLNFFPTYRYQQLLRKRSVGRLFDLCHEFARQGMEKIEVPEERDV